MSSTLPLDLLVAVPGLCIGAWAGLRLGARYGTVSWRYWLMNAAAFGACLAACVAGLMLGTRWVAMFALGVLGGLITGLKYGRRGGFLVDSGAGPTADGVDLAVDEERARVR